MVIQKDIKKHHLQKNQDRNLIFSKFVKNFKGKNDSDNSLSVSIQDVSNDKYLKLYRIKSNLVDYNKDTLESSLNFTHESDDIFFGLNASVYETLKENYEDKYEYILPELTIDKNLINSATLGNLDLQTNLKVHNYETNKLTNFIVNDFNWTSKDIISNFGFNSKILGNIKNINYEAKNVDRYKTDPTSEIFGALGLLSEIDLVKKRNKTDHHLTPKVLVRYAPGSMRKEDTGSRLSPINAFSLNRLDNINNFETGLTGTLGFDYKVKNVDKEFDFSLAQIISEKENKKMNSKTSLDEKLSDLVGAANIDVKNKFNLNYKFSLDQNYQDINYNEVGSNFNFGPMKVDFSYLQKRNT